MSQQPVASIQEAPAPKHPIAFIFHFAFKVRVLSLLLRIEERESF